MRIQLTNSQYRNLQEALGDDIPDYMKDIIQKRYKGDYLTKDVPQHTDKIPNVKMEIKNEEIVEFASNQLIKSMTNKLEEQMKKSEIWEQYNSKPEGYSFYYGPLKVIMDKSIPNLGILSSMQRIPLYQIFTYFYSKEFRLPDSRLNDDSTLRTPREKHEPQFHAESVKWSNNKTGLSSFLTTIKRVFPETFGYLNVDEIIRDKHFVGLREPIINYQQNVKKIGQYPLYLYITDKPDDKLRMSVSQFYDSCQNIYTGNEVGTEWNRKLLSNVFDKNSKVAYLIYDKPYKDTKGNEHPFTSIARCILRVNKDGGVMFDKVYPTNLEDIFYSIITESTGIENVGKENDTYDYENVDGLPAPYMDKYKLKTKGGSNEAKLNALLSGLNVKLYNVDLIDDESYNVRNRNDGERKYIVEEFIVKTYDDALEKSKDIMRDDFIEIFGKMKTEDLMFLRILPEKGWEFIEVLNLVDHYDEHHKRLYQQGIQSTIPKYLSEVHGIDTVYDMEEELKRNKIDALQWFAGNIDMDELIQKKYRSEEEFIKGVLNWSHDVVGIVNGYVYYRVDYVEDR